MAVMQWRAWWVLELCSSSYRAPPSSSVSLGWRGARISTCTGASWASLDGKAAYGEPCHTLAVITRERRCNVCEAGERQRRSRADSNIPSFQTGSSPVVQAAGSGGGCSSLVWARRWTQRAQQSAAFSASWRLPPGQPDHLPLQ